MEANIDKLLKFGRSVSKPTSQPVCAHTPIHLPTTIPSARLHTGVVEVDLSAPGQLRLLFGEVPVEAVLADTHHPPVLLLDRLLAQLLHDPLTDRRLGVTERHFSTHCLTGLTHCLTGALTGGNVKEC